MINRDSMYASADGYGIISNINKLDYEDYVKTLNGIFGVC